MFEVSGSHDQGHMANTPACIYMYGKNPSNLPLPKQLTDFHETLNVAPLEGLGSITVCSNDDTRLTLTYFKMSLNLDVCVFEWDKLLNGHLMEQKTNKLVANDQIDYRFMFMIKV